MNSRKPEKDHEMDDEFNDDVERMIKALGGIITRKEAIGLPSTIVALRTVLDTNMQAYAMLADEWRRSETKRH
jgi:hypothetical protein